MGELLYKPRDCLDSLRAWLGLAVPLRTALNHSLGRRADPYKCGSCDFCGARVDAGHH